MIKQRTMILMVLLVFGWVLAACNTPGSASATPAPVADNPAPATFTPEPVAPEVTEASVEPTALPTPEPEPEPEADAPATANVGVLNNFGEPTNVDSYRMSMRFESVLVGADGSQTSGSILLEGARDVALDALTFSASATGTADFGGGQQMSFTRIDSAIYLVMPNSACTALPQAPPGIDLYDVFIGDGGMLGELVGAQLGVPATETVNNVLTNHYVFDETNLNPIDETTPDVTAVDGNIYLSASGGYVVRIAMTGRGSSNLLNDIAGEGDISYELNYFDFDAPVNITVPAGC